MWFGLCCVKGDPLALAEATEATTEPIVSRCTQLSVEFREMHDAGVLIHSWMFQGFTVQSPSASSSAHSCWYSTVTLVFSNGSSSRVSIKKWWLAASSSCSLADPGCKTQIKCHRGPERIGGHLPILHFHLAASQGFTCNPKCVCGCGGGGGGLAVGILFLDKGQPVLGPGLLIFSTAIWKPGSCLSTLHYAKCPFLNFLKPF